MKNSAAYDYLVIGNSVAAIAAAEAIRQHDPSGSLALISAEPQAAYSRPLISYLLAGKINPEGMSYRDESWYTANSIEPILGQRATSLDTKAKTVTLEEGRVLGYGKLLLATGGTPIVPETPGRDLPGVFTFTTWEDAEQVEQFLGHQEVKRAVVVGAGLIGLKAAEALLARGVKVTMVELSERVLGLTFDERASQIAQGIMQRAGAEVITGNTVSEIVGRERVSEAKLQDGRRIECEMVIFAIGVRPAVQMALSGGLGVERGIVVNERMETSVPEVYAAGDVAQGPGFEGGSGVVPIWPNAYRQGKVAGTNMAGGEAIFDGSLVMNAVSICGVPTISAGDTQGTEGDEVLERVGPGRDSYRRIVLRDNRIVGFVLLGGIERAGIITGLIRGRTDVSKFREQLLSDDFGLISLPREIRKHMVSGTAIEV